MSPTPPLARTAPPRAWWWGLLLGLLVSAGLLIALPTTPTLPDLLLALSLLPALWLAEQIRRSSQPPRHPVEWQLLGLATLALSYLAHALLGPLLPAGPTLLELLLPLGAGLLAFRLFRAPLPPRTAPTPLRRLLDPAITLGALATLAYLLHLNPLLADLLAQPAARFWPALRIAAGWLLALAAADFVLSHPAIGLPPASLLIALALATYGLSDAALTFASQFTSATPQLALLIRQGAIAALCAGLLLTLHPPARAKLPPGQRPTRWFTAFQRSLPLLVVGLLFTLTLLTQFSLGQFAPLALILASTFTALAVIRQGIIFGEGQLQQAALLFTSTSEASFVARTTGQIRRANPAAQRLFNRPDLRNANLTDLLAPALTAEQVSTILRQVQHSSWRAELDLPLPSGQPRTLTLTLDPVYDEAGAPIGIVGTIVDITARKRLEDQLRAVNTELSAARDRLLLMNAELERKVTERTHSLSQAKAELERRNAELQTLDQLKSDFVSLVSHELRTPLASINGGLELLLSSADLTPAQREDLQLMQSQAHRLTQLVTTILNLSALEAGRLNVRPMPIDLADAIADVRHRLLPTDQAQRLTLALPPNLPFVLADLNALRSILGELIDNACKYAPTGDIILSAHSQPGFVWLAISDSGPGVPPDQRERIFERFHRAESDDARHTYGYGLGLYMVRLMVTALNGEVGYQPGPTGAGATFWFTLPVAAYSLPDPNLLEATP